MNPSETKKLKYRWEKQIVRFQERIPEAIAYCKTRCHHSVCVEFVPPSGIVVYTRTKEMMVSIMRHFVKIGIISRIGTEWRYFGHPSRNHNLSLQWKLIKKHEEGWNNVPFKQM